MKRRSVQDSSRSRWARVVDACVAGCRERHGLSNEATLRILSTARDADELFDGLHAATFGVVLAPTTERPSPSTPVNMFTERQLRCPKCGHDRTNVVRLQTRSADEPMTIFATCGACRHRWRR